MDLPPRRHEIVSLICRGLTNKEIAHQLRISRSTVKNTICLLYDQTNTHNRVELTLFALQSGWVRLEERPIEMKLATC